MNDKWYADITNVLEVRLFTSERDGWSWNILIHNEVENGNPSQESEEKKNNHLHLSSFSSRQKMMDTPYMATPFLLTSSQYPMDTGSWKGMDHTAVEGRSAGRLSRNYKTDQPFGTPACTQRYEGSLLHLQ